MHGLVHHWWTSPRRGGRIVHQQLPPQLDRPKKEGKLDNTLITFIERDNGSSAEGSLQGTANEIGVIITQGGRFAGWGLLMIDGRPTWVYKNTQQPGDGIRISGADKLAPVDHEMVLDFTYDGKKGEFGKGGTYVLSVDGHQVAQTKIDHTVPLIYSVHETLDIGQDSGTPILDDYADRMPFAFNGTIAEVDLDLKGSDASAAIEPEDPDQ